MYGFENDQPGPSRQSYYNNYSFYTEYPPQNPASSAVDRAHENRRGARQSYNSNYQNNANMMPYSSVQRAANQRKPITQNQQKDKTKRDYSDNRDKGYRPLYPKKNKNNGIYGQNHQKQKLSVIPNEVDCKVYKCPNCSLQFDCTIKYNNCYVGRVPLILNCKHTVCQECLPKMAKNNTVLCPICENPSVLPPNYSMDTLQDIFAPNLYLIGFITCCKSPGISPNLISLVPATNKIVSRKSKTPSPLNLKPTCCFLSCNKIAILQCQDCSDVYCQECSTAVHKSAKSLWSHKQVAIEDDNQKNTLELEVCTEHKMHIEFYCTICNTNACCYCVLEQHEGHVKDNLAKLTDAELETFKQNKENAKKILKQLIISQRQLKNLQDCSTANIEKKISNYFMNLHAKLQHIEKNLRKEIATYAAEAEISNVDDLDPILSTSIENMTDIVVASDILEVKKMNVREIAKRLENLQNLPCYLMSDNNKGPKTLEFVVDPFFDNLEESFKIKKCSKYGFKLVSEKDLPSDYEKDADDHESEVESCINSLSKQVFSAEMPKVFAKPPHGHQVRLDSEPVEVTHIESLECFYVQLKKTHYQFMQMNRDINDYIKMGAPTVDHPQLNELYLVVYQTRNEKIWCRGRVTEIKNGEMEPIYEIFFIDYGSNQTVDVSKLRQISSSIANKKAFAVHCELYNPSMASWSKNAHVFMGKMINGKSVSMIVKRIHSGVHEVDLMVVSSDGGQTSMIDILIHSYSNALSNNSDNESVSSLKTSFNQGNKIFSNSKTFEKFQQEMVILVNIIDPHHIFVHLVAYTESVKKMNNALKQCYRNTKKNNCLPLEGTYVIVDYKDPIRGNWHRGFVKKVEITNESCQIFLVDWGLNINVSWSSIRIIKEEFTRLESQAILVKMAHIEPFNDDVNWVDSAATFLNKYYRAQEKMKLIVHNSDPLEVALFEVVGDVDICINTQLVLENFAKSTGKISQTLEWPRNEAEVKPFTDNDGFLATLLKKVEAITEDSEDEEDKNVVRQQIEVVKFISPELIFIKFPMNEAQEMNLNKELQIHYSKEHKNKESWNVNELCVVIHNHSYARGKVLEKVGEKNYKVNVYDRAAEVVLHLDKIFEYTKYFNKFPNVIFKSHMANIRPAGGTKWSLSSIEALEKMFDKYKEIYGTKVEGDITGKSIPLHLWYTQINMGGALEASTTKFVSLNNLLVKLGYAYRNSSVGSNKSGTESVKSGTESVKSGSGSEERHSNSSGSKKSSKSTTLLSAIERMSCISDLGTDQDPAIMDEDILGSNLTGGESCYLETKDAASSVASVLSTSTSDQDEAKILDWNELIEEEETTKTNTHSDEDSQIREAEIEDWIPAFPIKSKEFYAWITCAETDGILYLREEKLQNIYKDMERKIKEYFDKKPQCTVQHNWEAGQLCTIHYNDYYYRGKVYDAKDPKNIIAVMIDFGSDHKLTANNLIREILYPKIPAFASKVQLHDVYAKTGSWLDSDYQTLLDIISEYAKIVIKSSLSEEIPTAEVYTNDGRHINQTLVEMCPNLLRIKLQNDQSDDDSVIIEEESIIVNDEQVTVDAHQIKEDENVTKTIDLEKTTVETGLQVDTTGYKYNMLVFPEKDLEEKNAVTVMSVLEYNKVALKETATITEEFFKLGDEMQKEIEYQPIIKNLEEGMPCACPFSEDGTWYRARIYNMEGLDCGYVFVFFVDFGNIESVSVSDIKMMRPEWFKFPVSCHIANVDIEVNSDKNIQHVVQHMKKLYGKNKYAKIISKDPLHVQLYESDGELCYASLLEKGLIKLK